MTAPHNPSSLVELLRQRAEQVPARLAYAFVPDEGHDAAELRYGELESHARVVAARLQRLGLRGQRALLVYPPGLDYIVGFFGCLFAGVTAVPIYPPRSARAVVRLAAILADLRPAAALTTSALIDGARTLMAAAPAAAAVRWVATDADEDVQADDWQPEPIDRQTLAFVQYTSGSTSAPRGVMLTHGNLLHNLALIHRGFEQSDESHVVSWLPPYHDMGLIGGILSPLHGGYPATLMSPVSFLQRPLRWLETISRCRATTSGGPNFAYSLCVQKIPPEARARLDLSSWTVAFNGAEPVRADTMDAFATTFASCGFRREAFFPCYGLAEATLMVSASRKGTGPRTLSVKAPALEQHRIVEAPDTDTDADGGARTLVSSGSPAQDVAIVDPGTCLASPPSQVGEIWVAGPSVAQAYWRRTDDSGTVFQARLTGSGAGPFLRTGDLGFLRDGELYVTGRIKDLIIIRGRNLYPQDLEASAGDSHPALQPGRSAAFVVSGDDEERVVILQEVRRQFVQAALVEAVAAVRQRLAIEHGVQLHAVGLLAPGTIPKTTSGKTQRQACRASFTEGAFSYLLLDVIARDVPHAMGSADAQGMRAMFEAAADGEREALLERSLLQVIARATGLRVDAGAAAQPLAALGVDSLGAAAVSAALQRELGVDVVPAHLLEVESVAALAGELLPALLARPETPAPADTEPAAVVPLFPTPAQERLWLADRLKPGNPAYNVAGAIAIDGPLHPAALARAIDQIVARHDSLRMHCADRDGRLMTTVDPVDGTKRVLVPLIDLAGLPDRALAARGLSASLGRTPFDLESGPIFRIAQLRLAADRHHLVVVIHHIACDGWSAGLFLRDLLASYAAAVGTAAPAQVAPRAWPESRPRESRTRREIAYWREQLRDAPRLDLPSPRPRPAVASGRGALLEIAVPPALAARATALARAESVTRFTVMLTTFMALLARDSECREVVIGTPVAGRDGAASAQAMGCWINPVVLRTALPAGASGHDAIRRVHRTLLDALAHAETPFDRLVRELQPERDGSHHPWFDVFATWQPASFDPLTIAGVTFRPSLVDNGTAKFDLTLHGGDLRDGGCWAALEYSTDLYDEPAMTRLAARFLRLLDRMARDPAGALDAIDLLSDDDRRLLLETWNATASERPPDATVPALIARQMRRVPEAVAVVDERGQLTYAELSARANQLAHALRRRGVRREDRVGVCLERSADIVAAILGVMKAGAAYVPLDPRYPPARLAYMLRDAGARVVITHSALALFDEEDEPDRLYVDRDASAIAREPVDDPPGPLLPEQTAYVIYTSGSTGRPKGVMNLHHGVVNLLWDMARRLPIDPGDVLLAVTPLSFDIAALEFLGPLIAGARVVVAPRATVSDGRTLAALAERESATIMQATPAGWQLFAEAPSSRPLRMVCGGEALPADLARHLAARGGPLWNVYGPTETTIWSTAAEITGVRGSVPIGRPLSNTQVYVLDRALRLTPPGLPGELFIGGAGVARGYAGRPALTAERFVPDPFGRTPGARLYGTGDRVRWLDDGQLEFFGRLDDQVKLRGHRIELGEIEQVVRLHPAVHEAVAIVRQSRLIAYVTGAPGLSPAVAELSAHLAARLPAYMVPAAIVVLPSLPRTPNNKIDRRMLPEPLDSVADAIADPGTATEALIASIWSDVLERPVLSTGASFFAVGGHSLLAMRIMSRLRDAVGVDLPVRTLFEAPTVRALAARVDAARRHEADALAPAIVAIARDRALPLSFAQQRLWFLAQLEPGSAAYNIPIALRLRGALDVRALAGALTDVAGRHDALRTTFEVSATGEPSQIIHAPCAVPLPVIDLASLDSAARDTLASRLVRAEASRPFDLARGPVLRVTVLRLGALDAIGLVTVHHIAADSWSTDVLVREVTACYEARRQGRPMPLAPLALQYADYAVWQRQWLEGAVLDAQLRYWREQLADVPTVLDLPTDRPRPPVASDRGGRHAFALPPALVTALRALSREEDVTPYMTLLAAWQALLSRHGAGADVVMGTPVAGRTRVEIEPLIGFFVNTLVIRTALRGDPAFRELLHRVRATVLDAQAHQDLPFERLVHALDLEHSLAHAPLLQVMFVYQQAFRTAAPLTLDAVDIEPLVTDNGTSRFDLHLEVNDFAGAVEGILTYRRDLFDPPTIEALCARYVRLLAQVAADVTARVSALALLTAEERTQVIALSTTTAPIRAGERPLPSSAAAASVDSGIGCLHERLDDQTARTPDAAAVAVDGGGTLTYAALDAQACQVAQWLRAHGVGREARVGVCAERSLALMVGLVGVLKAGAAYVPLDPTYPAARLRALQAEAGVTAVILQAAHAPLADTIVAAAGGGRAVPVLVLDEAGTAVADLPATPVDVEPAAPEQLAYILFTSGSTGQPKGAMNTHRGIVNRLAWMQAHYALGADETVLQKTPIGFDVSTWEYFWPLLVGARLVLARPEGHRDPAYLTDVIARAGITTVHFVPPMLRAFLEAGEPARCGTLRRVLCSGEALSRDLLEQARRALPQARLGNLYGPTEAAVDVTVHDCAPGRGAVPIGRPIANTQAYVLGAAQELVPLGVPGELYLGGVQVGRGYVGQPALTATRFVPDPWGPTPGGRLYRTGDRARWRPDEEIEFLGRLDAQVKIRGYRIEPGEIETALRAQPGVGDALALVRADGSSEPRLVAYVTPAPGSGSATAALDSVVLQAALRTQLPAYLVPAAIVVLAAWPVTAHGKVDRRALPAPSAPAPGEAAPTTAAEAAFARIWCDVLYVPAVGVQDDFFRLGGDSILSIQIVARAGQAGWHVTTREVFEHPTVAGLARIARRTAPIAQEAESGSEPSVWPLAPAQHALLAEQASASRLPMRSRLIVLPGLNRASLRQAAEAVVSQQAALRLRIERTPDGWRQMVDTSERLEPAVSWIDVSTLEADAAHRTIETATRQAMDRFSPASPPWLRAIGFGVADPHAPTRVLVLAHPLAADDMSLQIALADLQQAHTQPPRVGPIVRLVPPASFTSWTSQIASHVACGGFSDELAYWREATQTLSPAPVPFVIQQASRRVVARALSAEDTQQLLHDATRASRTAAQEILLTALARLLVAWTGVSRVRIDLEASGRAEPDAEPGTDLSRTIGPFAIVHPVVLDLSTATGEGAALKLVKEQLRAVPHHGIGYAALRYLSPDAAVREAISGPPAPIRFAYHGQTRERLTELPEASPRARSGVHPLGLTCRVDDTCLDMRWDHAGGRLDDETIARLAQAYGDELRLLIAQCLAPAAGVFTPSDFPLAHLDQATLERLEQQLTGRR